MKIAALTSQPAEQGEVNLERRLTTSPPASSLTGSLGPTQHHLLCPQCMHTPKHTHSNSVKTMYTHTHTHNPVTIAQMYLFPQTELKFQTTPLSAPVSHLSDLSVAAFLSVCSAFNLIHPSANSRLLRSIFQIKLTQKQKINMVQMFHFITFVKHNKKTKQIQIRDIYSLSKEIWN